MIHEEINNGVFGQLHLGQKILTFHDTGEATKDGKIIFVLSYVDIINEFTRTIKADETVVAAILFLSLSRMPWSIRYAEKKLIEIVFQSEHGEEYGYKSMI